MKNTSILILRPLQSLLESGYPADQILALLYYQNVFNKRQYNLVVQRIDSGQEIVDIILDVCLSNEVSKIYIFFKEFNTPSEAIGITYDLLLKRYQTRQLFLSRLWYPLVLFILSYLFIVASKFFLFEKLFDLVLSLGISDTNLIICSMIVTIIFYSMNVILITTLAIISIFLMFKQQIITPQQLVVLARFGLFKRIITAYTTYYFLVYFNALLKYSISTQNIFKMLGDKMPDVILAITIKKCEVRLQEGCSITQTVDQQFFLDRYFKKVFSLGYHSDNLQNTLIEFHTHYQSSLENKFLRIASMFQYLLFLLTGIIIVFIYYSMLMPLFDITTQI